MKKTLLSVLIIGSFSLVSIAQAESYTYSEGSASASGGSSASVNISQLVDGQSHTRIVVNGEVIEDKASGAPFVGTPLPPTPPRETNRQIIERARNAVSAPSGPGTASGVIFEQHIQNVNGSSTGQVHVFRKENGTVVEDRVIQLPKGQPGKPYFFVATSSISSGTPHGFLMRSIAASGSRASFLRGISTTGLSWLGTSPISFGLFGPTTTIGPEMSDDIFFSFTEKKPPVQDFFDRLFNMFKMPTGGIFR